MNKETQTKMNDKDVSFEDFYQYLQDKDLGDWDNINSEDTIKQYVTEKMNEGIIVSHIVKALEENPSTKDMYNIWLGNSMETPIPINNKEDLVEALELVSYFDELKEYLMIKNKYKLEDVEKYKEHFENLLTIEQNIIKFKEWVKK